jgi:hypothetical protein
MVAVYGYILWLLVIVMEMVWRTWYFSSSCGSACHIWPCT